ncbi:outer membrane beta-barrel protein [Aquimarina sp. AU474]|uniref:outer membrane beta-barrel protein n=1 Tax=Aquimarina sp. AU474 TaxID=2108529 RepID=UPI001357D209|nr:outer membrane beta-barrel protein [Aquimarina sp. AU474]
MKIHTTLFLLLITISMSGQERWMLGFAPSLELEEELIGINGRFYYGLNEQICFGPEVTYFPYQSIDSDNELAILDLNVNVHYIFEVSEKLGFYPLTGINYTIEKERLIEQNDQNEEENEFGLNYGFGAHYNLKKFFAFAEFKGVSGKLNDEFITIGVIFPLVKHKEKK